MQKTGSFGTGDFGDVSHPKRDRAPTFHEDSI